MPHTVNGPQSQQGHAAAVLLVPLRSGLGRCFAPLTCSSFVNKKKKKSFTINPACAAVDCKTFLWVWISVLGPVPSPCSQTYLGDEFYFLLNTSRGGCAQVRRSMWLCQPQMLLSGHTLKWEDALAKPQRHAMTRNIYLNVNTVSFKHNETNTVSTQNSLFLLVNRTGLNNDTGILHQLWATPTSHAWW